MDDPLIVLDGFDDALVGEVRRPDGRRAAVYDYDATLAILVGGGVPESEAVEVVDSRVQAGWLKPGSSLFVLRRPAA